MSRSRDPNRPFHQPTNAFGGPPTSSSKSNAAPMNANTNASNINNNAKSNRRIKQGKIEIDFEQSCLVVNFDVEITDSDESGRVLGVVERVPEMRRIKIKAITPDKNLAQMAEDIIDKCKYIHPSRIEEVEQQLIQLKRHQQSSEKKQQQQQLSVDISANDNSRSRSKVHDNDDQQQPTRTSSSKRRDPEPELPPSKMDDLDDYLDMLYQVSSKSDKERDEAVKKQVHGTAMILQLCRDIPNLEHLIQNSTVMGALTRVLQDEHKKSDELTFNILRIFLSFSNFLEMHPIMTNYKIGALTMKVVEFELKRIELREQERLADEASYDDELNKLRQSYGSSSESQVVIQDFIDKMRKTRTKQVAKSHHIQQKQDKVLFACFYILVNLAEDVSVERKMIKKDLVPYLLSTMDLTYANLLVLIMLFVKKLTIYQENKDMLKEMNIISKCIKFLSCSSTALVNASLRLLFNLSFDHDVRNQLLKAGIVPKLVMLLKTPAYRGRTLKLLYHLSVDDRCKSMITYTEAIPMLMGMIVNFPQPQITKELAAVMVNLSHNPKNVEQMISNRGLNYVMDRLDNTKDSLLLKIIRNISTWTYNQQRELENPETQYRLRGLWSPFIKILLKLTSERESHEILVEVFGCLANMTSHDLPNNLPWSKVLKEYNMLSIISKLLVPGMAQNDLLLEIILLLGTVASEPQVCDIIATSSIIGLMYQIWKEKADDVEIQLQLIHCFYKLILHEPSREEVLYSTRIVVDIIDYLTHRNNAIRLLSDKFCELVVEYDRTAHGDLGQLGIQIRKKRFESYNGGWLSATGAVADISANDDSYLDDSKVDDGEDEMDWQGQAKDAAGMGSKMRGNGAGPNLDNFERERYLASEAKYSTRDFMDSMSDKGEESWGASPGYDC